MKLAYHFQLAELIREFSSFIGIVFDLKDKFIFDVLKLKYFILL